MVVKKSLFIVLFAVAILLTGCTKDDKEVNSPVYTSGEKYTGDYKEEDYIDPEFIECEVDTNYKLEKLDSSKIHVTKPSGVYVFNEQLIVCDKEENKLVVLDTNLNFVKEIKTFEPEEEEILNPTGITIFNDNLYLLDAGNSRVLVLDSEFEIKDTIELKILGEHPGGARYKDIAIDKDGVIYVCSDSIRVNTYIYVIENGEVQQADIPFMGYLAEYNGEVYAVDCQELSTIDGGAMAVSGKNNLYRMNKTKMEKVKELPYKLTPTDFMFVNDKMIMVTTLEGKVYRFSCDNYEAEKELACIYFIETSPYMHITALNETDFIITESLKSNIMYYLHY